MIDQPPPVGFSYCTEPAPGGAPAGPGGGLASCGAWNDTTAAAENYNFLTQWVNDLGYKLWSIQEIRDGTVYKRFKSKLGL